MINEEKKINDIFGKENHFKVPEGYFDNFAEQMMARIPMQEFDSPEETDKDCQENKAKFVHLSLETFASQKDCCRLSRDCYVGWRCALPASAGREEASCNGA